MHRCRSSGSALLRCSAFGSGVALLAATAVAAAPAPARYEIQARTSAGMGAGGSGMEMVRMMMGGGAPAPTRSLDLTLSAFQAAPAAPQAEHLIPAGLQLGAALPLRTSPPGSAAEPRERDAAMERPRGRLILFRGCAGSAAAAQKPEVIDLATLLPEQRRLAAALASRKPARAGAASAPATPLITGSWPNQGSDGAVPAAASLVGDHRVQSNYAPEIRFQVNGAHDFLAPVQLTVRHQADAIDLSWLPIATALGSQAMAFGSTGSGEDVVIWSSSAAAWSEGSVPAAPDAATARGLISRGVLLPPDQTTCGISPAAAQQLGTGIVIVTAYGDTLRAAAPAGAPGRPPLWTLTLTRESTSTLPLMPMGEAPAQQPEAEPPRQRGGWGLIPGLF